jgi:hypothetical protein
MADRSFARQKSNEEIVLLNEPLFILDEWMRIARKSDLQTVLSTAMVLEEYSRTKPLRYHHAATASKHTHTRCVSFCVLIKAKYTVQRPKSNFRKAETTTTTTVSTRSSSVLST